MRGLESRAPLRLYALPVLWAAVLLGVGSVPNMPGLGTGLPLDKVAHLLLYGVLGLLAGHAWHRAGRAPAWLVVALALLVGVTDELHQRGVAGRSAELADWIMDATGIIAGFWLRVRAARRPHREHGT